ncbi:MAG: TonB-dependent receptor [candidate division Zixibacteria bacterium]|nr:TonB-dependent receptor [candidate division Zixibacteria bacterium]
MLRVHRPISVGFSLAVLIFGCFWIGPQTRAGGAQDVADLDLENLLDNMVLSASKHRETLEESPANVFVVSRTMIENYGCQSSGEALSLAPGVYVTDDYSVSQIGVRGVSMFGDWNSHVMILIDGRPTNEQYGGTSSIDVPGLDIDNVDRIEVIKGPASSLYGSNAFFGLINIITRQPDENGAAVSGRYCGGSDQRSVSMELNHQLKNGLSIFTTWSILDQRGNDLFFPEYSDPNDSTLLQLDEDGYNQYYLGTSDFTAGWARDKNTQRNYSTHSRVSWRNFSMTLHIADLKTGIAHSMWGSLFQRPENQFREQRSFVDLAFTNDLSDQVDLTARLSYSRYVFFDDILYNYGSLETSPSYLPGPIWKDWEFNRCMGADVRLDFDLADNHRLLVGGESQFHLVKQVSGNTGLDHELIVENVIPEDNVQEDGQIYNLYAQDEYSLSPSIKLVSGLHFNYYTYTTGKAMPKGAVILTPYRGGTWKFIASRGFRSPTFYEMTYEDGDFYYHNYDLVPELITNYEIIASHQFPYGLTLGAAANTSRITDLIQLNRINSSDPAHPGGSYGEEVLQFRNSGQMRVNSFELSLRGNPVYRLSGFANLTWQEVKLLEGSDELGNLSNSPRWLANVGLNWQLIADRLSFSAKTQHISSRKLWDGSELAGTWLTDVTIQAEKVLNVFDVRFGVKNLFDLHYRTPLSFDYAPSVSIEQPGRSVALTVRTTTGW